MSLTIDPPAASIPASGGNSAHTLANAGEVKVIFKVKCSNNNDYRLKPVFGFVDPAGQAPLEIIRTVSIFLYFIRVRRGAVSAHAGFILLMH
ncbi:unnamed protein product [Haemonchus placei]|uniref:MSP domain-containing protein n=1 Tax=Haemonchus placei TaxID=6290 RepID=A0A0N4X2Q1_HAEPC|nr:unnamed protein product [Haemonchus placei]